METQLDLKNIHTPVNRTAYIAGPFFNDEQLHLIEIVECICEERNVICNSPREFLVLPPKASWADRYRVFKENIYQIQRSQIMIALVDSPDTGTNWEMGYAYAIGRPVVCLSLSGKRMNVMLAQGCTGFLENAEQLHEFLKGRASGYAQVEATGEWWDFNWDVAQQWRKEIY